MEFWFVLALLSALFWGFGAIFAKLSTPKLGVTRVAGLVVVIDSMLYFAGYCLWRSNVPINLEYGVLAAASAFVGIVAYLCFFESLLDGQVAIVGTISAAYPALTVIGALIFLSETLTAAQTLGLVAVICGIVALSYERNQNSLRAIPKRSLFFALMAFALWGFWSLTSKVAVSKIGPGNVFGFYVISSLTVPLVYAWFRKAGFRVFKTEKPSLISWVFGAAGLALNVSGTLIFSFALSIGQSSLVVPISGAYPLVTVTMALLMLGEKLNRFQLIALAFVIMGLVLIGIVG